MKLNRLIGIIGGIILIISPFLPWSTLSVLDLALISDPWGVQYVFLIVLILLIVGGIVSFFKGLIGGIVGLVGMIIFTVLALYLTFGFGPIFGIGYYLGWIGSIISIASIFFKPRATPASV
ncbi:MAG: hypothetical protein H3Z49_05255 [archaeon]|nr:hypothetical protein [archaeon]